MKKLMMAVTLACAPIATASAQFLIDGTTPGAASELVSASNLGDGWYQTFTAKGTALSRVSFWFYGGTLSGSPTATDFFSEFSLVGINGTPGYLPAAIHISQLNQGRVDIDFQTPFATVVGGQYRFLIWTNNCTSLVYGGCGIGPDGPFGAPITGVFSNPRVEVTQGAYDGGFAYRQKRLTLDDPIDDGTDLRFELAYSAVPEPSTYALMAAGLAALGLVARRRRVS